MTDLKRERALIDELYAGDKGLFYWNDEDTRRIANALAAARREGAEAAVVKLKAEAVAEVRDGALEEAARVCDRLGLGVLDDGAAAIRALKKNKAEPQS